MESPPENLSPRRHASTLLLLAALVFAAYANSFSAGFVFDSAPLILNDARVHSLSLRHLQEILEDGYWWPGIESGLYRPLTTLSYLFNYAVLGSAGQPTGYHAVNLLLHCVNAFLVYLLILQLSRRYRPALFAAALWALHPALSEAVTNIIGRADELAALGVLSALLLYIRSTRETGRAKTRLLTAMMAAAAVAVFSKESGIMLVALVPLYDLAFRIPRPASLRAAARFRQFFWEGYLDFAIPILAMLGVRWTILRHAGAIEIPYLDNPLLGADLATRWATAIRLTGKYLWLLFWPQTLSVDYSYNQIPLLTWNTAGWRDAAAAAAILALFLAAALCYRKRPLAFFLIGFSALTLLPAANLLVTTGTIFGERLLYLPAVGFAASLALAADLAARRAGLRPIVAAVALGAIALACGARTFRRNFDWRTNESLFASAVQAAPASFKTHTGLANAWAVEDPNFLEGERAIDEAQKAADIVEGLPDGRITTGVYVILSALEWGRGDTLARRDAQGNIIVDAANAGWYRKALDAAVRGAAVDRAQNENHRRAELARGTPPERIGLVGVPDAWLNLGTVYLRLGDPSKAVEAFLYQRRLDPRRMMSYTNLASAHLAENQLEPAAAVLLEALALHPSAETLGRLADVYAKIDGGDCALAGRGEDRAVRYDCPVVRRDACIAYRDLASVFREAHMEQLLDRIPGAGALEGACR